MGAWTGRQMLIWGGDGSQIFTDGAAYDPASVDLLFSESVTPAGRAANSRNTRRGLNQTSFSGRMGSVGST